jgi:5-methyltetrahydrofolate--homocysteine methyltransferase
LPQLLLSADTVSCAFEEIKAAFAASGETRESAGTIALATVYGDIHDIGKNIVKALLENYGYTVIDLGKNVDTQTIIETVIAHHVKLVGLSALMTTTVANMEKTIAALREALARRGEFCVIMSGGAVLTAEYAKKIGADYYAKDALAAIAIAKEVFV